jgi:hypothetical protein
MENLLVSCRVQGEKALFVTFDKAFLACPPCMGRKEGNASAGTVSLAADDHYVSLYRNIRGGPCQSKKTG